KQAAARRERFALRQRVATLEEEQASLRSKFSITRQDDLLRHVLSTTVDFDHFTVRKVVAVGGNGAVLLCDVTVPAWCVADAGAAAVAAGARTVQVPVAVKVLAGVEDPRQTTLQHAFLREFQTLSDMPPHPNVITLLAFLTKRLPRPMYDLLPDGFRTMVGDAANPVLALIMPLLPHTLEAAAAAGAEPAQLVRWCLDVSAAVAH
ncbi:MAG: hypothetical protein ACK41V_23695, partial [Acidovorax sp.]|uniref:hypothetical protein n=1 Tax=Acidovorax sp. TaxID=1872122 RepID=UPI003919E74D